MTEDGLHYLMLLKKEIKNNERLTIDITIMSAKRSHAAYRNVVHNVRKLKRKLN